MELTDLNLKLNNVTFKTTPLVNEEEMDLETPLKLAAESGNILFFYILKKKIH